jgi:membrane protein required for colicin V production
MGSLTALDIIVLILVGGGLVAGVLRGFAFEILSLFAWVAAIIALKLFHTPATEALRGVIGTGSAVAAFALVFGIVFIAGKLLARRIGGATKRSVIGPVDRILGGGFGALKGLIGATLLYLASTLIYDTIYGRTAKRPEWMAQSRSYPLLNASGNAMVDYVERRRTRQRQVEAQPELRNDSNPS